LLHRHERADCVLHQHKFVSFATSRSAAATDLSRIAALHYTHRLLEFFLLIVPQPRHFIPRVATIMP